MSRERSGVAIGFTIFAAVMLLIIASFDIITGLARYSKTASTSSRRTTSSSST